MRMNTQKSALAGRSQRDDLEQVQEALRELRGRREVLSRESEELAAEITRLEDELRSVRQERDAALAEWNKPVPSLPDQLVTPFCVTPSRRTLHGRIRFALPPAPQLLNLFLALNFYNHLLPFANTPQIGRLRVAVMLASVPVWFLLVSAFSQGHANEDERLAWSFDDEGFRQVAAGDKSGKVLYSEVHEVEVRQDWLQRRYGLGSVRVSWLSKAPTAVGKALKKSPLRVVGIGPCEAPERLAEWLRERTREAREAKQGGANAG